MDKSKLIVYVAANSKEWKRAEFWVNELEKRGIHTTSTWIEEAKSIQGCNRLVDTHEQRWSAASSCVSGIGEASLVWILMPETSSMGAFWEFGYAKAKDMVVYLSGAQQHTSVFSALADYRFEIDAQAFNSIVNLR